MHHHGRFPDLERGDGFEPEVSSDEREGSWRNAERDGGDHYPYFVLLRLAAGVGRIQYGEGSICRAGSEADGEERTYRVNIRLVN